MAFRSFALPTQKPSRWATRNSAEAQTLHGAVDDASLSSSQRRHQETQLETAGAKIQFTLTRSLPGKDSGSL